jgi:hypothetical protein
MKSEVVRKTLHFSLFALHFADSLALRVGVPKARGTGIPGDESG